LARAARRLDLILIPLSLVGWLAWRVRAKSLARRS
jgi:hypothetical protein